MCLMNVVVIDLVCVFFFFSLPDFHSSYLSLENLGKYCCCLQCLTGVTTGLASSKDALRIFSQTDGTTGIDSCVHRNARPLDTGSMRNTPLPPPPRSTRGASRRDQGALHALPSTYLCVVWALHRVSFRAPEAPRSPDARPGLEVMVARHARDATGTNCQPLGATRT